MDRLTRRIERKANQITVNRQPLSTRERNHRTVLIVFDNLMKFDAEVNSRRLEGQERARLPDDMAIKAADEIQNLWR